MKKAWQLELETMQAARPVVLSEEEQGWSVCERYDRMECHLNEMKWKSNVPGSGAEEHVIVAAMQDMENMGYDVSAAEALIEEGMEALKRGDQAKLALLTGRVFHLLSVAPRAEGHLYHRYPVYDRFESIERAASLPVYPYDAESEDFLRRTHLGWQAQICAGALGTAIEGYTTENITSVFGQIYGYPRTPNTMNDDITYELAFLEAAKEKGRHLTAADVAEQWLALIPFGWSAEEVALKNLRLGIYPPESGYRNNPYREWIGAQMRGAVCGMVAPGNAREAARLAFLDGSVSHHNNGILGEIFNAVLVSLSYVLTDVDTLLKESIAAIPEDSEYASVLRFAMEQCDAHGDWLNQRDDSFSRFIEIGDKKNPRNALFKLYSSGLKTARDAWVYGSSIDRIKENIDRMFATYNQQAKEFDSDSSDFEFVRDDKLIHWNRTLENFFKRGVRNLSFESHSLYRSIYRPFFPQHCYFNKYANDMTYQIPLLFPSNEMENLAICSSGVDNLVICINQNAKDAGQIALMTDHVADLHFNGDTQCFPRWLPGEQDKAAEDALDFGEPSEMPSGFSSEALPHFQAAYPGKSISEDDLFYYIYGILHSEDYRTRYANNLMKELPRIPRVATYEQFKVFVEAGQELARLHVHFEDVAPYAGVKIEYTRAGQPSYRVTQMKWGKIKGKTGNAAKDKTTLIYNDWITVKNIPLEAQEYVVNKKSALDWVVERACVSIDKASGIVNDFNDYAAEMGSERYPLDLFLKIITVSLETMKIVRALPKLELHPLDKA